MDIQRLLRRPDGFRCLIDEDDHFLLFGEIIGICSEKTLT